MTYRALAITLSIASALVAGCAGSNASRGARDQTQRLSLSELNAASQRLVTNVVASKSFARFKQREGFGENKEVAVFLRDIENRTGGDGDDSSNDVSFTEQLFDQLEERFAENDVRLRFERIVISHNGPADDELARQRDVRVRAAKQVKRQDTDDGIDQSTGSTLTGATAKASLFMDLVVFAQPGPNGTREWELRTKIYDAAKETLLVSASSQPKAADN